MTSQISSNIPNSKSNAGLAVFYHLFLFVKCYWKDLLLLVSTTFMTAFHATKAGINSCMDTKPGN